MNNLSIIILGAGLGSRMKSSKPKALQSLGGVCLIDHLIYKANLLNPKEIIAVIGDDMPSLEKHLEGRAKIAYQKERLGSGHAVLSAKSAVDNKDGVVMVLYTDTPLVSVSILQDAINKVKDENYDISLVAFNKNEQNSYGKLVLNNNNVVKIVEYADANEEQKQITLCNSGVMAFNAKHIWNILEQISNNNKKSEYYLTDALEIAYKMSLKSTYVLDSEDNLQGANSKVELAILEEAFQNSQRQKFLDDGVQLIDPKSTFFAMDTKIGQDVIIHPNVVIGKGVVIGDNVEIKSFSVIEDSKIGNDCKIGPFARLRPQAELEDGVHIGNFVEVKKSVIKSKAKINHLSYIGDAIVGQKTNIGAGTITCNYNGKEKFNTIIGDNAFIGSNTALIAPITIGNNAIIGAGSTITKSVPDDALSVSRGQQKNIEGYNKK